MDNSVCPCCGAKIVPFQERCTNCNIYLWDLGIEITEEDLEGC